MSNQPPSDEPLSRRGLLAGLFGLVLAGAIPASGGDALAQGRGWGPDGLGPPGQRRRAGGPPPGRARVPPGQRRRLARGRPLPPGQIRRRFRF